MLFNHYKLHKFVFFVIMFKTDLEVFMIERGKEVGFSEVLFDVESSGGIRRMFVGFVEKATEDMIQEIYDFEQFMYKSVDQDAFQGRDIEELKENFKRNDDIVIIKNKHNNIVGLMIFMNPPDDYYQLAVDCGLDKKAVEKTSVVAVLAVNDYFRGLGIQRYLLRLADRLAKENKSQYLCATVSPNNKYSLANFLERNYEIKAEKIKYGNKNRYILLKNVEND